MYRKKKKNKIASGFQILFHFLLDELSSFIYKSWDFSEKSAKGFV
jgi:hypothetical protein